MIPPSASPKAPRLLVLIGGAGLLTAVATDALAVVKRHIGGPILGSIELVQAAVLIVSSVAILIATIERRHAAVHLLRDRLPPARRQLLGRLAELLGTLFLLALTVGSAWIALDMIGAHERSELLHIPFEALRLFSLVTLVITTGLFAWRMVARARP
jgi:TRAP-type transport system small permease protein